jgi:hypothetical protein
MFYSIDNKHYSMFNRVKYEPTGVAGKCSRRAGMSVLLTFLICGLYAQTDPNSLAHTDSGNGIDSASERAHPDFDKVSKLHRVFFGENYRKEWAVYTRLPVIRLSTFRGGLTPIKEGGGNQTHSLRLKDKNGDEWVIRSVEKYPETILPVALKKTFIKDIVTDAMSAQHPYAALIVPPIANAVGVPHAEPVIGIIAPDSALGAWSKTFSGTICLLEEREPGGKSDNYFEMLDALNADNDNSFDSTTFLKARILDVFVGDWDRHRDQWRFRPEKYGKGLRYTGIPRDRDQVFYTNQGVFPSLESLPFVQPFFEGFNPKIRNVGTLLFTSTILNIRLINQFSYEEWMKVTNEFVSAVTDSVLETAVQRLPSSSYDLRHKELLQILKARRADLPRAMSEYFYFLNRNVFIQTSNKSEFFDIKDTLQGAMQVNIFKLSNGDQIRQNIFSKTFFPKNTKEIRFFIGNGDDSIYINSRNAPINLRFSGLDGNKRFHLEESKKKVQVFEKEGNSKFTGNNSQFKKNLSNDSANTAIIPGNLFNVFTPLIDVGYNPDDGVLIGLSAKFTRGVDYTRPAFSTNRYTSVQQFSFLHSFYTRAFSVKYDAEWVHAIGRADLLIHASVYSPDVQNFFGTGNQTSFFKTGNYKQYYRSRFNLYTLNPSLRWGNKKGDYIRVGPSLQYYTYDSAENAGRFIETNGAVQTYDSATLSKSKLHGGVIVEYNRNRKDHSLLPTEGYDINIRIQGYAGLNTYSESYAQLFANLVYYKSVDSRDILVLADRIGGGATVGNPAFYQSMFIGGQGNLMGYRLNRFAGQYMAFNNLEARIRLAQFANYILPGQLGLVALYDIGRVWQKEDQSNEWHNGVGAGFYFAPAQVTLIQFVMSWSPEGWYPTFKLGLRF